MKKENNDSLAGKEKNKAKYPGHSLPDESRNTSKQRMRLSYKIKKEKFTQSQS
ncbi:MAG: hypothetical protein Q8941_10445 [Bacteroidota bacterium]|nr:hypothetical protein [Bacteroidota bacterium]